MEVLIEFISASIFFHLNYTIKLLFCVSSACYVCNEEKYKVDLANISLSIVAPVEDFGF